MGELGDITSSPLDCIADFSISLVIDLASSAVSDLCIEGDVMGEVGLWGGCDMERSKLEEEACLVWEAELERTLCLLVWLPPPLGGECMVNVVADKERIGLGDVVDEEEDDAGGGGGGKGFSTFKSKHAEMEDEDVDAGDIIVFSCPSSNCWLEGVDIFNEFETKRKKKKKIRGKRIYKSRDVFWKIAFIYSVAL